MVKMMKTLTQPLNERPTIIMSGSTHGNEYLNLEDRLPEEFLKQSQSQSIVTDFLNQGGVFIFVPILNPDGYVNRVRTNSHNVDLNRDWDVPSASFKGFQEVETKSLSDQINTLTTQDKLSLKVSVDYHCCIGAFLYPRSYVPATEIPKEDMEQFKKLGEIANKQLNVPFGTTPDLLGYSAVGTTKDYYYEKYHSLSFTYEGRYKKESELLAEHVSWWEEMIRYVVKGTNTPLNAFWKAKAGPRLGFSE
jgi:predicted deacylase